MNASNDTWLVVIDMQRIFAEYPKWWGCPRFDEIIPPIRRLAARFGERTLLTRFVAGAAEGSWGPYYKEFPFACVPGSDPVYDVVEPLRNLVRDDNVITMPTFSKWSGIEAIAGTYPHLVLTGVATDCCVLSTAMAAAEAGAFVTVLLDACAASSDANQLAAERILKGYAPLISVRTTGSLLAE